MAQTDGGLRKEVITEAGNLTGRGSKTRRGGGHSKTGNTWEENGDCMTLSGAEQLEGWTLS